MSGKMKAYDHLFKLMFLGDSGVGKTSLFFRYSDDVFTGAPYVASIGIEFKVRTVMVGDKVVKLQIWDTAGQERFRTALPNSYVRQATGFVIVFDVTDERSFNNLTRWTNLVEETDAVKILLGNENNLFLRQDLFNLTLYY